MTTVEDVIERLSSDDGIADSTYLYPWVDCRADAMLSRIEQRLTTLEGNQYAVSFWSVQHWTAGLIDHLEFFELEDFDTARSCFEALAREPRTPHVDNAAVRMMVRGEWLARHGDAAAIEQLAPAVVEIDHRRGVSAPDIVGIGAYVENQRAVRGLIGSARIEHLAVRGERLVLARVAYTSREQFEATHLALFEYDDAGRLGRTDIWDDDDRLAAIDAMESRHRELAGEAPVGVRAARRIRSCRLRQRSDAHPDGGGPRSGVHAYEDLLDWTSRRLPRSRVGIHDRGRRVRMGSGARRAARR